MQAFGEVLVRTFLQARTTYLAGLVGVHEQHTPISLFRFIDAQLLEHRPPSIIDRLVEARFGTGPIRQVRPIIVQARLWPPRHIRGGQVLKYEGVIGIHQSTSLFVLEITALVGHLAVQLADVPGRFLAPLAPSLLPADGLLFGLELLLGTSVVARIRNGITCRESGQAQRAEINADRFIRVSQPGCEPNLDGKTT